MNDDKLKDIFASYNPQLADTDEFMKIVEKKLEAAEIIKQYNKATRRRSRIAVAVAFVLGVLICFASIVLLSAMPQLTFSLPTIADAPLSPWEEIRQGILSIPLFITRNINLIAVSALIGMMSFGVIKVAISYQDLSRK